MKFRVNTKSYTPNPNPDFLFLESKPHREPIPRHIPSSLTLLKKIDNHKHDHGQSPILLKMIILIIPAATALKQGYGVMHMIPSATLSIPLRGSASTLERRSLAHCCKRPLDDSSYLPEANQYQQPYILSPKLTAKSLNPKPPKA